MNKMKTKDKEIIKKEIGITTEYDKTIFCRNLFIGQVRDVGYSSTQMTVKSKTVLRRRVSSFPHTTTPCKISVRGGQLQTTRNAKQHRR